MIVGVRRVIFGTALVGALLLAGCASSTSSNTATATPTFSPGGGTYTTSQTVTIGDSTPSAVLYCTVDGTTPTTASPQCAQPTTVFKSEFLQAMAVAPGMAPSTVATAGYTINLGAAATPTFTPGGGTYTSTQTVAVTSATAGANIFYTTDGTTPTSSSTVYTTPIPVSKTETISAIAVASGYTNSGVAIAAFTINPVAATPVFSPASGTYTTAQTVTISDATAGAQIYYTTNGSFPSAGNGTLYTAAIPVSATTTVQAVAVAAGYTNSAVATASYTINLTPTTTPVFSPAAGTYTSTQTVTISDSTSGASIYYTLDGTTPTASSNPYTGAIQVASTETIKAIAVAAGSPNSAVATAAYTINSTPLATPVFSPAAGAYSSTQTVTISDSAAGATIYYTVDGSTPTVGSSTTSTYTGAITVGSTETIKAIATATGFPNSAVATAAYTINTTPLTTPTFSPAGGTYTSTQTVTISDSASGVTIYYTLDGSTPTPGSPGTSTYNSAIQVAATETLKAIAVEAGFPNSAVASANYTITAPPAATPTFSPAAGTYTSVQTVTITDSTSGAQIYYTEDGTTPTTASKLYGGAITVGKSETIQAIAVATGFSSSPVATAVYTLNIPVAPTPTFSLAAGTYVTAQSVTISDSAAGAVIHYTTDGTPVTDSSPVYDGTPIGITTPKTINALAVVTGDLDSPVATATYNVLIGTSTLSGTVLSGTVPVIGAQVQLYTAGQTGYGSGGDALIPITIPTDSNGAFTFTYNCPAAPGDQVYLIATGGDSGLGANSSLTLMTALGSCNSLAATTGIVMNEATTVASAYSLAQFELSITSGSGITVGSSPGGVVGLGNAMKTVPNLVTVTSGSVLTITPFYKAAGGSSGGMTNGSYVPQARIDTLANMLNGCAHSNGSGTGCSALFSAATPPSGSAPVDTLQAIVNIAQHPGTNAAGLYGVASKAGPFQPVLSSAPSDWTLALTFEGGGLGVGPGVDPGDTGSPSSLAIDAKGNIWMMGVYACTNPTTFSSVDAVFEFDNQGNALSPGSTAGNKYCGGYQPKFNGSPILGLSTIQALAVNPDGTVWVSTNAIGVGSLAQLFSDGTVKTANVPTFSHVNCGIVEAMAIDQSNILWQSCDDGVHGGIGENSAADGTPIGGQKMDGKNLLVKIYSIALDPTGSLWGVAYPGGSGGLSNLYQFATTTNPPVINQDFSTSNHTFMGSVVADGAGNIFSVSGTPGTLNALVSNQSSLTSFSYPLPSGAAGVQQLAVDGAGNLWGAAYPASLFKDTSTIPSYLVQIGNTGTVLSPSSPGTNVYGYTGTGGGGEKQPILQNYGGGTAFGGIAVDGSGNLWVANYWVVSTSFDKAVPPGEQLVEFIGIAAPVVTPAATALQTGKLGVRP